MGEKVAKGEAISEPERCPICGGIIAKEGDKFAVYNPNDYPIRPVIRFCFCKKGEEE